MQKITEVFLLVDKYEDEKFISIANEIKSNTSITI